MGVCDSSRVGEFALQRRRFAAPGRGQSAPNRDSHCTTLRQRLQQIGTRFASERDNLIRLATKTLAKKLNKMTKVISGCTDERGGCEQSPSGRRGRWGPVSTAAVFVVEIIKTAESAPEPVSSNSDRWNSRPTHNQSWRQGLRVRWGFPINHQTAGWQTERLGARLLRMHTAPTAASPAPLAD